jgi:hypothetical protein
MEVCYETGDVNVQNLLQYGDGPDGRRRTPGCGWRWVLSLAALLILAFSASPPLEAQSTGDPTPNALELGPRCPTCAIVIFSRPMSPKDKEDRDDRKVQKRNYNVANAARKHFIDDETNKMLILARDLKAKIDGLGSDRPSSVMLREAAVIEFLAKDIKEKMKLTVNPD